MHRGKGEDLPEALGPTRKSLEKKLRNLASDTRHIDRLVFYYTGQANREAGTLRLNVRGEDIIHSELVLWLGAIKAEQRLIVLDCPCAGVALKDMANSAVLPTGVHSLEDDQHLVFVL